MDDALFVPQEGTRIVRRHRPDPHHRKMAVRPYVGIAVFVYDLRRGPPQIPGDPKEVIGGQQHILPVFAALSAGFAVEPEGIVQPHLVAHHIINIFS
jgi:hypothetical protein